MTVTMTETKTWSDLAPKTAYVSRDNVINTAVGLAAAIPGNVIEFGVANGDSTRTIVAALHSNRRSFPGSPRKRVYACDSFQGLTERFENADVGTFACKKPTILGAEIVEGFFQDTLTDSLAARVGRVALASLDADLYSSTRCALDWLTPLLGTGSLLLFDEFLGEKESEKRAFTEWQHANAIDVVQIASFAREPSGWGQKTDQRVLFQVVIDEPLRRHRRSPRRSITRVAEKILELAPRR